MEILNICVFNFRRAWKVSSVGTPCCFANVTKALMFSMHAKFEIGFWTFFIEPGWSPFASLDQFKVQTPNEL
jgi:hypothetical protein